MECGLIWRATRQPRLAWLACALWLAMLAPPVAAQTALTPRELAEKKAAAAELKASKAEQDAKDKDDQIRRLKDQLAKRESVVPPRQASAPASATVTPAAPQPAMPVMLDGLSEPQMRQLQQQAAATAGLGARFRDEFKGGGQGPELVVVPAGRYTIGAPDAERKRYVDDGAKQEWADWEKPRLVGVARAFALAAREVTRGEFAAFVKATGRAVQGSCWYWDKEWKQDGARSWQAPGFEQTDDHPVVCVSWEDARDYAAWMSTRTRKTYRLPSEAEWELAARAGTVTRRFWGDDWEDREACAFANVADQDSGDKRNVAPVFKCRDGAVYTAAVGRHKANALGLHDMLGNATEWVADCWDPSHGSVPINGSARSQCAESRRVVRGGSWDYFPRVLRSAYRSWGAPVNRINIIGFRLARTF